MNVVSVDLDKLIPELIELVVSIHGTGISHIDAVRITELIEDNIIKEIQHD